MSSIKKQFEITIKKDQQDISPVTIKADEGTNLMELLIEKDILFNAPCGGRGTCGKCRVKILNGAPEPLEQNKKFFTQQEMDEGFRLSCNITIHQDMSVQMLDKTLSQKSELQSYTKNITTDTNKPALALNPLLMPVKIAIEKATLANQLSDVSRVFHALADKLSIPADQIDMAPNRQPIQLLQKIEAYLHPGNTQNNSIQLEMEEQLYALVENNHLVDILKSDSAMKFFGIAFDIGTTTIAAYLYNLSTGDSMDVISMMNPQKKYGSDVITRIDYTLKSTENREKMQKTVIEGMNHMIHQICSQNDITADSIYLITVVGNTTMLHLLTGLNARQIATAPFIPVTTCTHIVNAPELNLGIHPSGRIVLLPSISAYIGADTVAGVLSTGMHSKQEASLLIDIGTNGEIVIGNRDRLYTCSTAAGPAFEGANIQYGTGGISGAISAVVFHEGKITISCIDHVAPVGICGSGLLDAVSEMLKNQLMDETGRILSQDELTEESNIYASYVIDVNGNPALLLDETSGICITQKDIRELQNAKAAIAAGIETLIQLSGIKIHEIDSVYLAGGFGNFLRIDSALTIGLIPSALKDKIKPVGNAAGAGAIMALLSKECLSETQKIKTSTTYLELSSSADFVTRYTDNMFFE